MLVPMWVVTQVAVWLATTYFDWAGFTNNLLAELVGLVITLGIVDRVIKWRRKRETEAIVWFLWQDLYLNVAVPLRSTAKVDVLPIIWEAHRNGLKAALPRLRRKLETYAPHLDFLELRRWEVIVTEAEFVLAVMGPKGPLLVEGETPGDNPWTFHAQAERLLLKLERLNKNRPWPDLIGRDSDLWTVTPDL